MNKKFLIFLKEIKNILQEIIKNAGTPYLVGGSVRDYILDRDIKDVDIEVHNIDLQVLENVLKKFGIIKLVGRQFGVLRLQNYDIDWSLPRKDSIGRKPSVEINPNMTIEMACKRRDLTMNAMAIDLSIVCKNNFEIKNLKIIDPYGGIQDIKEKKLRAVDTKLFLEDPLRFFRVMQFIGRFEFFPDAELNNLCKKMDLYDQATGVPIAKERIGDEIKKLFLKSKRPSLGFRWLQEIDRLREIFPEIYNLIGVKQRPDYHPEGDVFEHTMQALDLAAIFENYNDNDEKYMIMLGVLCHDLGKVVVTDEELHAKGHCEQGVPLSKKLLKRFTQDQSLINAVCKIVHYHMQPFLLLKQKSKLNAFKRLALKIAPQINLRQLALANLFDVQGRGLNGASLANKYLDILENFLKKAEQAQVIHGPEKPVLFGRHLMDVVAPGPKMGALLKKAYLIQIEEGIKDIEALKKRVL
ncbi:MAG: HD domain-containing protein [Candidatus Babeliales bacterium]